MRNTVAASLLVAAVCITVPPIAGAQSENPSASSSHNGRLKMVVILTRHGVRSPTWTQDRLDSYSALPWPKWDVPPGNLTDRGYEMIRQFGSFDRELLAHEGLVAAHGCDDASKVYVWADTDQRTMASGKAIAAGLFPACAPQVHGLTNGADDPLFHTATKLAKKANVPSTESTAPRDPSLNTLLQQMQNVLRGCEPQTVCTPTRIPQLSLLGDVSAQPAAGNMNSKEDPLALASSFSEDFLLEYANGMPMQQVGWGRVNKEELRNFLALHSAYFDEVHRTPELARAEASNMLRGIANTLVQAAKGAPVDGAVGPVGAKVVVLAGHDTNIAGVAALLGVHWRLDGRSDDTPPGTELAFELWQGTTGSYTVRVTVAMQTLDQLRNMPALTMKAPPLREMLSPRGCLKPSVGCALEDFQAIGNRSNGARDAAASTPAARPGSR